MKISIIGAGNVGSLAAMRIAQDALGDVVLVDIAKGIAYGKSLDLEDARSILKIPYNITGSDNIEAISGSDIVVVTAGLTRKPGMLREELLKKNAEIIKSVCLNIKKLAPDSVVVIVTNPLDLMTYLALKTTGFDSRRVFGMGITLDASRFANLISKELNVPVTDIDPVVIGSHGEGMLPLARLTVIKGVPLTKFLDLQKIDELIGRTVGRGQEIVTSLGSGSAFFAPSAAIAEIAGVIAKDTKRILGVSACLGGEYGLKDVCIGTPCRLGKKGIEQIIELRLESREKEIFLKSADKLKEQNSLIS